MGSKELDQAQAVELIFDKYPLGLFGERQVTYKLEELYGYDRNIKRDRLVMDRIFHEVSRIRMRSLAKQHPGYKYYKVIAANPKTEAELEEYDEIT